MCLMCVMCVCECVYLCRHGVRVVCEMSDISSVFDMCDVCDVCVVLKISMCVYVHVRCLWSVRHV